MSDLRGFSFVALKPPPKRPSNMVVLLLLLLLIRRYSKLTRVRAVILAVCYVVVGLALMCVLL